MRAAPGMLQVSFGGFLSTTLIRVNSFLPFLFPVALESVSENLSFHRFVSLSSQQEREMTLAQSSIWFSSKYI